MNSPQQKCVESAVTAHQGALIGFAFSLLRNLETARDEAQNAFLKLTRADCPGIENHRAWLMQVCRNACLRTRERAARQQPWSDEQWSTLTDGDSPDARASAQNSEQRQSLLAALDTLPPRQAEVLRLRYLADLNTTEIARILGTTPNNVHQIHHAALVTLRARLPKEF